ncbi:MAG TPA: hypothetical protein VLA23_13330 [Candidatus Limnocylindrales bacterium]|nr:hypothetical protein [Candidatus Limnocylindrales bacterium]
MTTTAAPALDDEHGRSDWRRILAVFWVTRLVGSAGVSQIFAWAPACSPSPLSRWRARSDVVELPRRGRMRT